MNTHHAPTSPRPTFLGALLDPAPHPGVLVSDPLVRETLHTTAAMRKKFGTDVFAWRNHYQRALGALGVPVDWLTWWTGESPNSEIRALQRLHRLLSVMSQEPIGQTLTVAEAVSRLSKARLMTGDEAALFRPSVRQQGTDN